MEEKIRWIEKTAKPTRKRALTESELDRLRLRQIRREQWMIDNPSKAQQLVTKESSCPRCGKSGQLYIDKWQSSCLDCVLTQQEWEKKTGRRSR